MINVKFCILGAGPSGLTYAHQLKRAGITSFVVLEQEAEAGGLCRSQIVDGHPLDIGGGHFLDVRRREVLDFLFSFMPREEWREYSRVSKIRLRGKEIDHPLEGNLWQLPLDAQVDFLESIARAGATRGEPAPSDFASWIRWKLGDRIADEYMLPYNRKIWSMPVEALGTYWLHKLPAVSFPETLRSCLEKRAQGTLPAHGTFLYPARHGYGEVWRRMAADLGDRFVPNCPVRSIDPANRCINGDVRADTLVTTIPWTLWPRMAKLPAPVVDAIGNLAHTSVDVDYHPENLPTDSHWTYEPDEKVPHHRYLLRHNFVPGACGYWTETNALRSVPPRHFRHHNPYAYPVNTTLKPAAVDVITRWAHTNSITCLGRWGTWEHLNSDIAVAVALQAGHAAAHQ